MKVKNKIRVIKIIFFVLIVSPVVVYTLFKEKNLQENSAKAQAKIIEFRTVGGKYYVKYIFYVNGKKYDGEVRTNFFKCDNGVKGCVGERFTAIYSKIDPTNNEIDMGKYNENKLRTRVYKLEK